MKFNQYIYIMLCLAMFGLEVKAELPDSPPKKWPCDQVYNPKLDLKALWQGPDIKDNIKNWWKDDEVIEAVT